MTVKAATIAATLREIAGDCDEHGKHVGRFAAAVVILLDAEGNWAGCVGGQNNFDLAGLLQTCRDSVVKAEPCFQLFYDKNDPENIQPDISSPAANELPT